MKLSQKIKRLSHKELSLDDRYKAAAEVTAILIPDSHGSPNIPQDPGINADTPDVVKKGYLRSLGEMLQHVLQVVEDSRRDPRFWRLLDVVISAEGIDKSVLDKKLPSTARNELQDCLEKGDFTCAENLAEGLAAVFGTIHRRFTLGVFTSVGKWVELLEVCFSLLKSSEDPADSLLVNVKSLLELLLTALVGVVKEEKAWFSIVVNHLLVPALEWMMVRGRGNDPKDPTRNFLQEVLFRECNAKKFAKFFMQRVHGNESDWRDLDLDKEVKRIRNPVLLFFKAINSTILCDDIYSRVDDMALLQNARSAVLTALPWMFQCVCNLLDYTQQNKEQEGQSDLRFRCFIAFLALILPPPSDRTTDMSMKKRKACNAIEVPWERLQTVGKLLEACSASGAYNPTQTNSVYQMSIIQRVMEETMEAWERKKYTKCRKTSFERKRSDLRAPIAENAVACVIKAILFLEHRVTLEHTDAILEIAFVKPEKLGKTSPNAHGADILIQLIRVYKDIRQLDTLLETVLKCVQAYTYKECSKVLNGSFLAQLQTSIRCAPPMQRKELVRIGFKHMARCAESLNNDSILATAELVCSVLQATILTVSEAAGVASVCASGLQKVLQCTIVEGCSMELPLKGSAALTVAILRVTCSTISLHRKCEMIDPDISPLDEVSIKHGSQRNYRWQQCSLGARVDEFVSKCVSPSSLYSEWAAGCNFDLENAWRKGCMECLLQRIAVVYTAWHKHSIAPPMSEVDKTAHNGIQSQELADTVRPSHPSLKQSLQALTKCLFTYIPLDWYGHTDTQHIPQHVLGTEPLFSSDKGTVSNTCWIDLCASFSMWAPQTESTTLTGFLKRLIDLVGGSYRKKKPAQHPVEAASWELFVRLDSFTDDSVQCKLIECLGASVQDLLQDLSAHSETSRFKKISRQNFFGGKDISSVPLQLVLKQATKNAQDCCSQKKDKGASPDVKLACRLENFLSLGAGLPWESFSSQANKGVLIGLGGCATILMMSREVRMSFLPCSTALIVWVAHASVSGNLDQDQIAFMVSFAADIVQLSATAGPMHEGHVIQVLDCMGLLGMSHKAPFTLIPMVVKGTDPSTSLKHVACVWDALAVGICRWAVQKDKKRTESSDRKLLVASILPLEQSCAQRLQHSEEAMRRGYCQENMRVTAWAFGCQCHTVAACINFHKNGSTLGPEIPPALALVPEVMGALLEAHSRESLHSLPTHTLLGLVDFVSQLGGVLSRLRPHPANATWLSLFRFHLMLIPPLPTNSAVDPLLQTSILMENNPIFFSTSDDTSSSNLRQCVAKSLAMLFDAAFQIKTGICDKLIATTVDVAMHSQNQYCVYAVTQALTTGLSAYQPPQDLLKTLPQSLMNAMGKALASMDKPGYAGYFNTCICLMLRALAIVVRSSTNTTVRQYISDVSRVGVFVFSYDTVKCNLCSGAGPFVECCNVISMIAARHSSSVLGIGVSSLLRSFHTLLETLVKWISASACDAMLMKCIESLNIASSKLTKLHGNIESLLVGLTAEYIQAVTNMKYATQVQSVWPGEKTLFQGCLEVYLATSRAQRKGLHIKFKPSGSRFVLDLLEDEAVRCIKYKRKV